MARTLIVVADLGQFEAFERIKHKGDSRAHLKPVARKEQPAERSRLSEQVSDSAGRFPGAGAAGDAGHPGLSMGERHNLELERQRRAVRSIADELSGLLAGDDVGACWLAVSRPIHKEVLDSLHPDARAKIQKALPLDLTRAKADEVLWHFE